MILSRLFDYKKQLEGKVTLQLFDAKTNNLIQEVKSQNFASNQTNQYNDWLQRNAFKTGLSAIGVTDTDYSPHQAANAMVLTDNSNIESPSSEWYIYGKVVGYAVKATYAGTDIWRGTVATTELSANNTSTKWVFDWPTHAGNGTIASVGWIDSQQQTLSATDPILRSSASVQSTYATPSGWTRFARASSSLAFGNTGTSVVTVLNGSYAQTTTFNTNAQFTAIRGLAWDDVNSFLWVIGDNGAARRIAAYNSSGILQTGPFTVTTRSYICLAYDGTSLWSITQDSGSNHTGWKMSTVDGSDVSNFTFTTNPSSVVCGLAWDSTKNILWMRYSGTTGIQAWDSSGNRKATEISTQVYTPSAGNYLTNLNQSNDFDMVSGYQLAFANSTTMYHLRMDGLGTRALLPSPVTKNNTQTLRLIYQINYT